MAIEIKARRFLLHHSRYHLDDVGVGRGLLTRQQPPTHSESYEEKQRTNK